MRTNLKKIAFLTLALLAVGGASMKAATFTYDFSKPGNNTIATKGDAVTVGGKNMWVLTVPNDKTSFDDYNGVYKFAFGADTNGTDRTNSGNNYSSSSYIFKNYNTEKGLGIKWKDRMFAVLGLKAGDKVSFTLGGSGGFKVYDGNLKDLAADEAIVSTTVYEVVADGDVIIYSTDNNDAFNNRIEAISITPAPHVVHIGKSTEYYDFEALSTSGTFDASDPFTVSGNTFNGRFAVTRVDNGVKLGGSGWGFQMGYNRSFTIKNLKNGDKVKINFTSSSEQVIQFNNPAFVGLTEETKTVVTNTWYTITTGSSPVDLIMTNTVNSDGARTNFLNITIITTNESITAATLVSSLPLDFSGVSGVSAYVATTANAGTVTFAEVSKVPANTPVYMKADAAGIYVIPVLDGDAEIISTNLLKGSASFTTPLQSDGDTKYYVFGVKGTEPGFYPVSTTSTLTSAAGKAYLQLTAAQAGVSTSRITMNFEDGDATGIENTIVKTESEDDAWYTLQGVRVVSPTRGIYVKNGKKIFLK